VPLDVAVTPGLRSEAGDQPLLEPGVNLVVQLVEQFVETARQQRRDSATGTTSCTDELEHVDCVDAVNVGVVLEPLDELGDRRPERALDLVGDVLRVVEVVAPDRPVTVRAAAPLDRQPGVEVVSDLLVVFVEASVGRLEVDLRDLRVESRELPRPGVDRDRLDAVRDALSSRHLSNFLPHLDTTLARTDQHRRLLG